MANMTLAIDDGLLRRARVKAVNENTSVNAVVRDFLVRWVDEEGERAAAVQRLRAVLDATEYRSGGVAWTRDELYKR
jgi:plasmid stability protein